MDSVSIGLKGGTTLVSYQTEGPQGTFQKSQSKKMAFVHIINYKQAETCLFLDRLTIRINMLQKKERNVNLESILLEIQKLKYELRVQSTSRDRLNNRILFLMVNMRQAKSLNDHVKKIQDTRIPLQSSNYAIIESEQRDLEEDHHKYLIQMLDKIGENVPPKAFNYQRKHHGNHTPIMFAADMNDLDLLIALMKNDAHFSISELRYIAGNAHKCPKIIDNLAQILSDSNLQSQITFDLKDYLYVLKLACSADAVPTLEKLLNQLSIFEHRVTEEAKSEEVKIKPLAFRPPNVAEQTELLYTAVTADSMEATKYLIKGYRCDTTHTYTPPVELLHHCYAQPLHGSTETPLIAAIRSGNKNIVKLLLSNLDPTQSAAVTNHPSVEIYKVDSSKSKNNVCQVATYPIQLTGDSAIREILCEYGANKYILSEFRESESAISNSQNRKYHEDLFQSDASESVIQNYISTHYGSLCEQELENPYHLNKAIKTGSTYLVELLLKRGVSSPTIPYISPKCNVEPPIALSIKEGQWNIFQLLIDTVNSKKIQSISILAPMCELLPAPIYHGQLKLLAKTPIQIAENHSDSRIFYDALKKHLENPIYVKKKQSNPI